MPPHRADKIMQTTLRGPDGSSEVVDVPPSLPLPTNLVVTGTVNVDETTYRFSPKVLDRAMVLEFDEVDLERLRSGGSGMSNEGGYQFPDQLPGFRLPTGTDYAKLPLTTHGHIVKINEFWEARAPILISSGQRDFFMAICNGMIPVRPVRRGLAACA